MPETQTHPLLEPESQAETDRLTGTVLREGNSVTFLPSGSQSYAKRWELIEGAQHSLDLVTFSIINDGTSQRLRDLVAKKVKEGVVVRMVVDDLAVYSAMSAGILNEMTKAGVRPDAWRDSDIYLSGPAVADVQRQFIRGFFLYDAMEKEYDERRQPAFNREPYDAGRVNLGKSPRQCSAEKTEIKLKQIQAWVT